MKQVIVKARVDLARKVKGKKDHEVQEFEVEFEDGSSESILNHIPDKKVDIEQEVLNNLEKEKSDKRALIAKLIRHKKFDQTTLKAIALFCAGYSENQAAFLAGTCHKTIRRNLKGIVDFW